MPKLFSSRRLCVISIKNGSNLTTGPGAAYVPSVAGPHVADENPAWCFWQSRVSAVVEWKPGVCSLDVEAFRRAFVHEHVWRFARNGKSDSGDRDQAGIGGFQSRLAIASLESLLNGLDLYPLTFPQDGLAGPEVDAVRSQIISCSHGTSIVL